MSPRGPECPPTRGPADPVSRHARVAVVRCPDYTPAQVEASLREALACLGGLPCFVKPGQTVLVKPNLLSPRAPGEAVTTHPELVAAVVRECRRAGAARVWVGDSPAGDHPDDELWERTGMAAAVPAAGGELRSLRGPAVPVSCGSCAVPVPAWLADADVVISLPKLKTHMLTVLTGAVKNVYGLIPGEVKSLYHGSHPGPLSMASFLADVFSRLRPGLTIMDAVLAHEGDGPATGTPRAVGLLLAGADAVAIDACCAGVLGLRPDQIPLVAIAGQRGLGVADRDRIELCGNGVQCLRETRLRRARGGFLQRLPEARFRFLSRLLTYRPEIDQDLCRRCGVCAQTCSQHAIPFSGGAYRIDRARCILCLCCLESCPHHAIRVRSPVLAAVHAWRRVNRFLHGLGRARQRAGPASGR